MALHALGEVRADYSTTTGIVDALLWCADEKHLELGPFDFIYPY